jgi:GrpB-like predicted nucleotidyltransferase (UPF0157 family)
MLLEKYTTDWAKNFEAIKNELEKISGINTFTIVHVGSTSVLNLDSKPIIDIDIIYYNIADYKNWVTKNWLLS